MAAAIRSLASSCPLWLISLEQRLTLAAADVAVDIGIEQLHEQLMEIGVDEACLRQELLRRCLVVGLRSRWEVRLILNASAIAMAAAGMDRPPLKLQEDLDLVLGELDP